MVEERRVSSGSGRLMCGFRSAEMELNWMVGTGYSTRITILLCLEHHLTTRLAQFV